MSLSVIIPAAGEGRRMRSLGPKALIELEGGQTVIGRQIEILRRLYGDPEIIVVVGHEAPKLQKVLPRGIKTVENARYASTGVSKSIELATRVASYDDILILHGDLVFNREAITLKPGVSAALVEGDGRLQNAEVGVVVAEGHIESLGYGLPTKWCQMAMFSGDEAEWLRRVTWYASGILAGFEVLNAVIERGGRFAASYCPPQGRIVEIDSVKDIIKARSVP